MYGTVELSRTYFTTLRFDRKDLWASADDTRVTVLLNEAAMAIDKLSYRGDKTDTEQEHEFPRNGDTAVPVTITYAAYEIAYAILDGRDTEFDLENMEKRSIGFAGRNVTKSERTYSESKVNGIPSSRAWAYLKPYLNDPQELDIIRSN